MYSPVLSLLIHTGPPTLIGPHLSRRSVCAGCECHYHHFHDCFKVFSVDIPGRCHQTVKLTLNDIYRLRLLVIFDSSCLSLSVSELVLSVYLFTNSIALLFFDGLSLFHSWLMSSCTVLRFRLLGFVLVFPVGSTYYRFFLSFPLKSLTYFISLGVDIYRLG